jgi:hypothetical protein
MIYYTYDNFISFSEKPRKAVSKVSFASIEEPIFTRFIVGDVKNNFKNNRRCRTTSASAGDEKMRRKTIKNWSVNSVDAEFHHHGNQYSLRASNQSAETVYKLNEKQCVVNAVLTTKQETQKWDYQTYLTSRFMRLKMILGRSPELVELYNAGFTQEEIDLMESLTDLEEWEPGLLDID